MPLQETSSKKAEEKKHETVKESDALREAAISGDFEKVRQLCAKSISIDCDEVSYLNTLFYLTHLFDTLSLPLLQDGRTALHYAAAIGHIQIVKLLIENGANVNANDKVRVFIILLLSSFRE